MIHYHGSPISGGNIDNTAFYRGRHAMVSYAKPEQIATIADVCQSFALDNGAFSVWQHGGTLDVDGFRDWARSWSRHPGFDWCLIPDVIDGSEGDNDRLIQLWPDSIEGVPVWHMHESIARLERLARDFRRVAIGSSGDYRTPGAKAWWGRMAEAMDSITDNGQPRCKLHGLRMLDPEIFTRLPFASADSCNAAVNAGSIRRFGMYPAPTAGQRAEVIAERIEAHNSSAVWIEQPIHPTLEMGNS